MFAVDGPVAFLPLVKHVNLFLLNTHAYLIFKSLPCRCFRQAYFGNFWPNDDNSPYLNRNEAQFVTDNMLAAKIRLCEAEF